MGIGTAPWTLARWKTNIQKTFWSSFHVAWCQVSTQSLGSNKIDSLIPGHHIISKLWWTLVALMHLFIKIKQLADHTGTPGKKGDRLESMTLSISAHIFVKIDCRKPPSVPWNDDHRSISRCLTSLKHTISYLYRLSNGCFCDWWQNFDCWVIKMSSEKTAMEVIVWLHRIAASNFRWQYFGTSYCKSRYLPRNNKINTCPRWLDRRLLAGVLQWRCNQRRWERNQPVVQCQQQNAFCDMLNVSANKSSDLVWLFTRKVRSSVGIISFCLCLNLQKHLLNQPDLF